MCECSFLLCMCECVCQSLQVHLRSAERLYDVCCHNGGIFIKVGQHLGALDYLLPKEYTKTFKRFHNNAPEMSLDTLKTVLQEDLGKKAEDIFDTIEAEPLGAASLAQCHKARLKDGRLVAVKVQFPSVRTNAETDLKAMEVHMYIRMCVIWTHLCVLCTYICTYIYHLYVYT